MPHSPQMEAQHPNSAKAGSDSCAGPSSAPAATPDLAADPSRVWLPELVQRIATFLPRNAIPCILRLVDSATAAQFSGWKHRTIHLSEPVPHGLFAARWSPPRATRNLPLELRCRLVALTAASGVVENMPVALAAAGCLVQPALLGYAAAAGQVKMCAWLHINGCPAVKMDDELDVLALAAARGHKEVCEWLLANRYGWSWDALCAAAGGGHVELMLWLWRQGPGAPGAGAPVAAQSAPAAGTVAGTAVPEESRTAGTSGTSSDAAIYTGADGAAVEADEWHAAAQAVLAGIPVDMQLLQEVAAGCDVGTLRAAHTVWHAADQRAQQDRREELRRQQQQRRDRRQEERRLSRERYGQHDADPLGVGEPSDEDLDAEDALEVAAAEELPFDERKLREGVMGAAAGSPTPCWRKKVAFLEDVGFAKCTAACEWAAAVEVEGTRQHRPPIVPSVLPAVLPLLSGAASSGGKEATAGGAAATPAAVAVAGASAAVVTGVAAAESEAACAAAAAALLFDLDDLSDSESEPEPDVDRCEGDPSAGDGAGTDAEQRQSGPDDALTRLRWLRRRGYPADGGAVIEAAQHGNTAALAFLLHRCDATPRWEAADAAAEGGHLGCLRLLRAARATMGQHTLSRAAQRGRLRVVRWLAERAGLGVLLDADDDSIMSAAAGSGCVPLLAYLRGVQQRPGCSGGGEYGSGCGGAGALHGCKSRASGDAAQGGGKAGGERGKKAGEAEGEGGRGAAGAGREGQWMCPWDEDTFAWAADGGCEEAIEWMAAHGCPMGVDGLPYVWAGINGDFATLACLRRLGCPWDPQGGTFLRALRSHRRGRWCSVPALQWLLDEGCPVGDWEALLKAARVRGRDYMEVVNWVERVKKKQEEQAATGGGGVEGRSEETSPARPASGCVPCCLGR